MNPGATALTRIFGARTRASVIVRLFSPALDAQYGIELPVPAIPATLDTFTISPPPPASMAPRAARAH
jgi:hypothetical protein